MNVYLLFKTWCSSTSINLKTCGCFDRTYGNNNVFLFITNQKSAEKKTRNDKKKKNREKLKLSKFNILVFSEIKRYV